MSTLLELKTHKQSSERPLIVGVDLFCGAGGLTHGLRKSGIAIKAGYDIDGSCRFAYEHNNAGSSFVAKSVDEIDGMELSRQLSGGKYTLLSGCAPCQTFSSINPRAGQDDERWWLLLSFSDLVAEVKPDFVTIENVPGLAKQGVFESFLATLKAQGYAWDWKIINCAKYGLPQNRRRLVLLASRLGDVKIPEPSDINVQCRTVEDALGFLEPIGAGGSSKKDPLHYAKGLQDINVKRIRASRPGGSWRDWEEALRCECHKKESGSSFSAVYGRMEWGKPSPTITTQFYNYGSGRFGHPEQDRALSFREGALLQTFPKNYEFFEEGSRLSNQKLGDLIGNAVPVDLGKIIGGVFMKAAEEEDRHVQRTRR